jgi:hypothetical protein
MEQSSLTIKDYKLLSTAYLAATTTTTTTTGISRSNAARASGFVERFESVLEGILNNLSIETVVSIGQHGTRVLWHPRRCPTRNRCRCDLSQNHRTFFIRFDRILHNFPKKHKSEPSFYS